jgi:hypothetical protein
VSIYLTTAYLKFPERDGLGSDFPDEPAIELSVDYTIVPGFVALRLDWQGSRYEVIHLTDEEAQVIINGLQRAIQRKTR